MNRTCTYKVAGHFFRFILPDSDRLWDSISQQYAPFLTDSEVAADELVFTLEFAESLPLGERVCIYDSPTEDGETVVRLYRQGDGWVFESSPDHRLPISATVYCDKDFRNARLQLASRRVSDAQFGINNAAMLLFAFSTACLGTIEMHASVIENAGLAYLFLGKSGTGKSTHSRQWLEHIPGSTLMNDDNPIVRVWPDGRIIAYGSPWSGKTPCYRNVEAPVGAYVQIRQCPENKIRRLGVLEGYSILFSSVSGIKDDDSCIADGLNDTLDKVLSSIPCYLLDCRPDAEAAQVCLAGVRG